MSASENGLQEKHGNADGDSNTAKRKRTPRKQTFRERWRRMSLPNQLMFLATLVIAVATVANVAVFVAESVGSSNQTNKLVGYARTQANSAGDQADAAQQFSDTAEDINGRMSDAVDQLTSAADNAKAGIRATQDTMRLDQRAWITVQGFKPTTFAVKQQFIATMILRNSGKTPAIHIRVEAGLAPLKVGESPDWGQALGPETRTGVLGPGNTIESTLNATKPFPMGLSPEGYDDIKFGRTLLYYYGKARYCDIFRKQHWTRFCNRFAPDSGEWEVCKAEEYNSVGDDEKTECPN